LEAVEQYVDKNVAILLLNSDATLLSCKKRQLLTALAKIQSKIIVDKNYFESKDDIGIQLLADAKSLSELLKVEHNFFVFLSLCLSVCLSFCLSQDFSQK
jgi:hypothetical protein